MSVGSIKCGRVREVTERGLSVPGHSEKVKGGTPGSFPSELLLVNPQPDDRGGGDLHVSVTGQNKTEPQDLKSPYL